MRLLISGSRMWDDVSAVHARLDAIAEECRANRQTLTVVHGAAKGVDTIACGWVRDRQRHGWPVSEDPHPADWNADCTDECKPGHRRAHRNGVTTYCPAEGQYRNASMVQLGADRCVAFIRDGSTGASGCADLAEAAGIPTVRVLWEQR
jgi:hypothetical protein